jgi:predicted RNA-binding protein with RPS1 domain
MYKLNDIISVTITSIANYGVFVKTETEYTGLIHISEINGDYIRNIGRYFKIGEEINARIIGIGNEKKQLNLSTKNIIRKYSYSKQNILRESGLGFKNLKNNLPKWIDNAKKELEKDN